MELLVELMKGWKPETQSSFLGGCVLVVCVMTVILAIITFGCWGMYLEHKERVANMGHENKKNETNPD